MPRWGLTDKSLSTLQVFWRAGTPPYQDLPGHPVTTDDLECERSAMSSRYTRRPAGVPSPCFPWWSRCWRASPHSASRLALRSIVSSGPDSLASGLGPHPPAGHRGDRRPTVPEQGRPTAVLGLDIADAFDRV